MKRRHLVPIMESSDDETESITTFVNDILNPAKQKRMKRDLNGNWKRQSLSNHSTPVKESHTSKLQVNSNKRKPNTTVVIPKPKVTIEIINDNISSFDTNFTTHSVVDLTNDNEESIMNLNQNNTDIKNQSSILTISDDSIFDEELVDWLNKKSPPLKPSSSICIDDLFNSEEDKDKEQDNKQESQHSTFSSSICIDDLFNSEENKDNKQESQHSTFSSSICIDDLFNSEEDKEQENKQKLELNPIVRIEQPTQQLEPTQQSEDSSELLLTSAFAFDIPTKTKKQKRSKTEEVERLDKELFKSTDNYFGESSRSSFVASQAGIIGDVSEESEEYEMKEETNTNDSFINDDAPTQIDFAYYATSLSSQCPAEFTTSKRSRVTKKLFGKTTLFG
ncbi:Uncharacterized protein QTN25_009913 [Entamoeba marina]